MTAAKSRRVPTRVSRGSPPGRAVGPYKARPEGTLKAATTRLVEAVGSLGYCAELVGRDTSTVHRWGDSSDANMAASIPADAIRVLEGRAGRPIVSAFLAAEAGAVVLEVAALPVAPAQALASMAKESAEALGALADSLADGAVNPREAGRTVKQLDEALAVFAGVRAAMMRIRDGGGV